MKKPSGTPEDRRLGATIYEAFWHGYDGFKPRYRKGTPNYAAYMAGAEYRRKRGASMKRAAQDKLATRIAVDLVIGDRKVLTASDLDQICPACAQKLRESGRRTVSARMVRQALGIKADKWKTLPEGWTKKSLESFWETLTGRAPKHKVTRCIKQMEGKIGDPGAFCASLADAVTPGWRKKESSAGRVAKLRVVKKKADKRQREREEVYADGEFIGIILDLSKHDDLKGDEFEFLARRYGFEPDIDKDRRALLRRIEKQAQNKSSEREQ